MATVLCVVGPTATGKTKMGVALAKRFNGEVVSVDSMQIYRGMAVGTAAPTAEEMEGIPHHMVAVADPAESWSAARYVQAADACVQDILRRGKLPVLVGGTGLYLELRRIDPIAAEKLHLRDEKRIIRALEVWQETGRTITEHDRLERQQPPKYDALYIGLDFIDRQDLRDRIDCRVDIMVEQGLLAEVKALLDSGLPRDATALQAIGYKQFLAVAESTATTEEAIAEVKLRSRQYAKRQLTWLRRNPDIFWVRWQRQPNFPEGLQKATEYLHSRGLC